MILVVAGARPNFMKIAPILRELKARGVDHLLVHTGQHYDQELSGAFFRDLGMPHPDFNLQVRSGSHARQTARILMRLESLLLRLRPALVLVVGDVNSTLAAALTAAKMGVPIAHVEAGLRSFDMRMPEEINRRVTDGLSSLFFTTEADARKNLLREGIPGRRIHFVGNVMIDTLLRLKKRADRSDILAKLALKPFSYVVLTLHRPENVDHPREMGDIFHAVQVIAREIPVVFPVHPRTRNQLTKSGLGRVLKRQKGILLCPSMGYLDFVHLQSAARLILTDSGGIQEEANILKVPCLTLRRSTERPVTVKYGHNILVGASRQRILKEFRKIMRGKIRPFRPPPRWDGRAAKRIVHVLARILRS